MDVKSLQEIKNCSEESGEWRKVCKSNVLKRKWNKTKMLFSLFNYDVSVWWELRHESWQLHGFGGAEEEENMTWSKMPEWGVLFLPFISSDSRHFIISKRTDKQTNRHRCG